MPALKRKTFQDRVAEAIDNLQTDVFPVRRDLTNHGRQITQVIWHHFPAESQVDQRMYSGSREDTALLISACGKEDFGKAEFLRRSKRGGTWIFCEKCREEAEITAEEFNKKIKEVMDLAFSLQDNLT